MKLSKFFKTALSALALAGISATASASTFEVMAKENSTSGGVGLSTLALTAGEQFSVSVAANDLWNAGSLPRWSNADGLIGSLLYTATTDAQVPAYSIGTQISSLFPSYTQGGLTAAYGTLVGQIGSGSFFSIGTSFTGTASITGTLKLFYFDSNNSDNTGSVMATVTAVPEPETYAMMVAGLGLMGAVARRRKAKQTA